MKRLRHGVLPALLALVLFGTVAAAQANGHHGRKHHGHHGHHGRVVVVGPGDSIQAAVDAAKPGTTIVVKGTHSENVAITKDGISLIGFHALLQPAATPTQNACFDPSQPGDVNGICVLGDVNFDTGTVNREVRNVTIKGFTIRGFSDSGIIAFGSHRASFVGNRAEDNGEYGIAAFTTTGTTMAFNRVSGSGEAGLYIGDSPTAHAKLFRNESSDNLFGILVRNAEHAQVGGNSLHDNCVGAIVLADAPGPAGFVHFKGNVVRHNTKACPAGEDSDVPLSGIGIGLSGSTGVTITRNLITGNVAGGETAISGGVVVLKGDGGSLPTNNTVRKNVIVRNDPDLFWDGTGTGNLFKRNFCRTSTPAGLCG
jgi:hypothetical protein